MKKFMRFLGLLFLALVLFIFGPRMIHAIYKAETSEIQIEKMRKEYSHLEAQEARLKDSARIECAKTRYKLFLWFHARGLCIDEGPNEGEPFYAPMFRVWQELFDYWKTDSPYKSGENTKHANP